MAANDTGKLALVTGAARRLGAAIARRLHAAGHDVLIHAHRSAHEAETLAGGLNAQREGSARVVLADLLDPRSPDQLVNTALDWRGRLDVLVNNASAFYPTPVGRIDDTAWHELIGSNLRAPLFLSQAAAQALGEADGLIVNLLDVNLEGSLPDHAVYLAAKGGLAALTRALALDLAPAVRVNGVAPGAILWPENDDLSAAERAAVIQGIPLRRLGSPEDIAATVVFLCQAPYITGEVISVDGGRRLKSST